MRSLDTIRGVFGFYANYDFVRRLALRLAAVALLAVPLSTPTALAQEPGPADEPFATLTITPYGDEVFDIGTGTTTLVDGGEVVDAATGIRLAAPLIRVQQGAWLSAREPVVTGEFGEVAAAALELDFGTRVLSVEGPLTLTREGLTLTAAAATYDTNANLASFEAPSSEQPEFEAERLLLDPKTGDALLVGPYEFSDGIFTLSSEEEGALLALVWSEVEGVGGYDATTDIPEGHRERFAPLLPA